MSLPAGAGPGLGRPCSRRSSHGVPECRAERVAIGAARWPTRGRPSIGMDFSYRRAFVMTHLATAASRQPARRLGVLRHGMNCPKGRFIGGPVSGSGSGAILARPAFGRRGVASILGPRDRTTCAFDGSQSWHALTRFIGLRVAFIDACVCGTATSPPWRSGSRANWIRTYGRGGAATALWGVRRPSSSIAPTVVRTHR